MHQSPTDHLHPPSQTFSFAAIHPVELSLKIFGGTFKLIVFQFWQHLFSSHPLHYTTTTTRTWRVGCNFKLKYYPTPRIALRRNRGSVILWLASHSNLFFHRELLKSMSAMLFRFHIYPVQSPGKYQSPTHFSFFGSLFVEPAAGHKWCHRLNAIVKPPLRIVWCVTTSLGQQQQPRKSKWPQSRLLFNILPQTNRPPPAH